MNRHRGTILLSLATLAVAAGAGCGKLADEAAEKATERAIEHAADGEADVDVDGDRIVVRTPDGSYEVDGDGNVQIDAEDGSYQAGSGELPEGWPSSVPLPEDLVVISGSSIEADGRRLLSIVGTTSLGPDEVVELVVAGLDGWEEVGAYDTGAEGSVTRTRQLRDGDRGPELTLTVGRTDDDGSTSVTYGYTVTSASP